MMRMMASAAVVATGLLAASGAWAWTMKEGTIQFSNGEVSYCQSWALDAVSIMLGRQENRPPTFVYDEYYEPSDATRQMRDVFERDAETYPIEETEEKKLAAAEKFGNNVKGRCFKAYIERVPQS
ncbi:hypothetical protein [Pseudomonas psychrophila]|uniref:hypothetical protein n=1 Tax=Pseudomonas psychrophila TaxID=122355 RepID=UPI0011DE4BEF|nr:hypothetical protein [Pseudomonas psychrophila]